MQKIPISAPGKKKNSVMLLEISELCRIEQTGCQDLLVRQSDGLR